MLHCLLWEGLTQCSQGSLGQEGGIWFQWQGLDRKGRAEDGKGTVISSCSTNILSPCLALNHLAGSTHTTQSCANQRAGTHPSRMWKLILRRSLELQDTGHAWSAWLNLWVGFNEPWAVRLPMASNNFLELNLSTLDEHNITKYRTREQGSHYMSMLGPYKITRLLWKLEFSKWISVSIIHTWKMTIHVAPLNTSFWEKLCGRLGHLDTLLVTFPEGKDQSSVVESIPGISS